MNINFIFRKSFQYGNFSIEKVFDTIILSLSKQNDIRINKLIVPAYSVGFLNRFINAFYTLLKQKGIIHITGDIHYVAIFLQKKTTILTIHDLVILNRHGGLKRLIYYYFWYYIPLKKSKYITVISNTIKQELIALFPFAIHKTHVIYNPLTISTINTKSDIFNLEPTILHIGTSENKNLLNNIIALTNLNYQLRIIGKLTYEQIELLESSKIKYSNKYNLSEEELIDEYLNADILSFVSTYEGFGLPIIEAQALGLPVLTSNISSMPEISGLPINFLANPYDPMDIRNKILKISNDSIYRNNIITLGYDNIKRFNIDLISDKYKNLYNLICENE
jgi:glycosyltransferase involved in cell wall biosynthesis